MCYNASSMKKLYRIISIVLIMIMALALGFSDVGAVSVSAEDRESLEEYLEELKEQILENNESLDSIYNSIDEVNGLIEENSVYLEELEESLEVQRESMKLRIRYMYEAGADMDILLALLTADSISEALNRSAYISEMVDYDREMLNTYIETITSIENTQNELETKKEELISLKDSFEETKYNITETMSEATERLAEYDVEPEDVQQVIEEYIISSEEIESIEETERLIEANDEEENTSDEDYDEQADFEEDVDGADEDIDEDTAVSEPDETENDEDYEDDYDEDSYEEDDSDYDDGSSSGYYVPISTHGYSAEDIYDMARVTYLEDGCVYPNGTYQSIYLCACVILNRANLWYGGSISGSIYAPGAYATAYKYTNWGGGELTINDITWQAVEDALTNLDTNPYYQCNGQWLAGYGLTEYYRDPISDEVFYLLD